MTAVDLVVLLPLIVPVLAGTAVMLAGAAAARRTTLHFLTVGGAALSVLATLAVADRLPRQVTGLLRLDVYALFYLVVLYVAVGLVAILVRPYLARRGTEVDAFYALLLFSASGMGVLACATHFASLFLGLEILTLSLYALIGYFKTEARSLEAAAKYLVLAALSSGFLLMGIALVYAASGTLTLAGGFEAIARLGSQALRGAGGPDGAWALAGAGLLLAGFGFKLALVPFHMWSPDVYQGAPAPVTALIASGSKGAVLAVMVRALAPLGGSAEGAGELLAPVLASLAVLTMFAGNLLALLQDDLKRLLAYSSVAHLGYVMVAMAAGGIPGSEAVTFYVLVYAFMTIGAFGVVTALSSLGGEEVEELSDYRGLGARRPFLAGVLTLMMLSLAGIPPTGGFLAKFAVLKAAVDVGSTGLAVLMALASGVGVYYYLRVVVVMYMQAPAGGPADDRALRVPFGTTLALATVSLFILVVGVWPSPWLRLVGEAVAGLY